MSCAERPGGPARFPLQLRAARTPDAPALIYRAGALPRGGARPRPQTARPAATAGPPRSFEPEPPEALTFRELDRLTGALAHSLLGRGVARGERVGLLLPPGPAYPALLLALMRVGAVAVPISTRVPGSAVPQLLARVGCRRLITDRSEPPGTSAGPAIVGAASLLADNPERRRESPAASAGARLPPFDPAADATIVFTSGSTGAPKAALHTFENHWASAVGANRNLPVRPGDRWLLTLPLWHVGGLAVVFRCLLGGGAIAVAGANEPLAAAIAGFGATHVSLVPTQLYRLLREGPGREALLGLKAVLLGGGPASETLIEAATRAGLRLVSSYGSTETSSQATATAPADPPEALRTAGRALKFREIAIAADGEILARGRTLFRGYLQAGAVNAARDGDGWFHTGDLGRIDDDGRLLVTGRRDTMFISGGENIHPEGIEREILRHPGILEAIVVPVPDPEFGARPAAFLRTADGAPPDIAQLERRLRETLPGFTIPRRYLRWPDIEEGLKPDRHALAALAREQSTGHAAPCPPATLPTSMPCKPAGQ